MDVSVDLSACLELETVRLLIAAMSTLPVLVCCAGLKLGANKAALVLSGSCRSCSACSSSLNPAWRCTEHAPPNQNVFIVAAVWESDAPGANSRNLGEICDSYIPNKHIQMLGCLRVPALVPRGGASELLIVVWRAESWAHSANVSITEVVPGTNESGPSDPSLRPGPDTRVSNTPGCFHLDTRRALRRREREYSKSNCSCSRC